MVLTMTDTPTRTPSSVHLASSPREHSPMITGVSALSSPTDRSADADGATRTPPSTSPAQPREAQRGVVETLSDAEREDDGGPTRQGEQNVHAPTAPQSSSGTPVHITAADYADRRRLLNHITYLSTQLQRAQLQVEDLTRTVCVLRGVCSGDADIAHAAATAVTDGGTSAAVLAAREEAEVHAALQAALAVFDPVIAQTQIYRLDDAVAQMGLLREAELAQLQTATAAAQEHRTVALRLSEEVALLRRRAAELGQQKQHAETALTAATLEVERLRHEELRLNQRVAGLQELAQDGAWSNNVRVIGAGSVGAADKTASVNGIARSNAALAAQLEEAERLARQELLLELFWDPILIAFDAGITWITDSAALQRDDSAALAAVDEQSAPQLGESERLALAQAGIVVDTAAPPTDADLLLLRRQQEEVTELRARLQLLQDRDRIAQLEKERLHFLYESEVRRSERMAQDHVAQLQQAYDEVVKDRQCIMHRLKDEVGEQLRIAFEDGRAYERGSARSRSRPRKKPLRSSNAVAGE